MPNFSQSIKPIKINTDKAKKFLSPDEAAYLLNHDILTVPGKSVPLPANSPLCEVDQPNGDNYSTGDYYSPLTNEAYSWVYNTEGQHYLQRVNGDGTCEIVNTSPCLNTSDNPANSVFQWRSKMRIEKVCHNRHGKQLLWVDGTDNDIFCLDVEASIATDSFTTPFFDKCPDPCAPLKLCVPDICGCVTGEFAPLEDGQENLSNHFTDVGVKIIVRHVYYDLRASEWSVPSTLFYQDIKGGCFGGDEGFSRCLKLTIPLGNPLVDKIEIGYSIDNGATWLLSDTIEKYASYTSANQYWYERDLNPDLQLTSDGCSFYYYFCNNKQCQAIDPKEVARVYNPLPRAPQGLIEIKDAIGAYNYKQGNCPLDKAETDKFAITPNCENTADCVTDYVTVKVRVIVHNLHTQLNQFVYRMGGAYNDVDDEADTAYFGGVSNVYSGGIITTFSQQFAGKKRDFTAYIEGTNYSSEMKQFKSFEGFGRNDEVGIVSGMQQLAANLKVISNILAGNFFYQEATFKVPKGTRGFIRLTSHESASGDSDTSTFVWGTIDNIANYKSSGEDLTGTNRDEFEIYFDTCSGPVELQKAFLINDNAEESDAIAFNGYVVDASGAPLAGVSTYAADDFYLGLTDHNGFYHFVLRETSNPQPIQVRMEKACDEYGVVQTISAESVEGKNIHKDIRVTDTEYATEWYAEVVVTVRDCDGNQISGIPVAASGAKFRYTDDVGMVRIPIRNNSTRNRQVRVIAMDAGGCFLLDCNGNCNPCRSSEVVTAPACFSVVHFVAQWVEFQDIIINVSQKSLNSRGLKKGGRYGFGIVAMGDCGRISSVYESGYLDIPKFQTNSSEDFCAFSYDANGINLPDWVKCLQVVRTANLNEVELQWLVDKIEKTGDGKIILTIQSLNDYKEKYSFKTNVNYQYQQGDRIEFISNGDGKVFSIAERGLLSYTILSPFNDGTTENTEADFFNQLIIQDDGKLQDLVIGAKIEIQREKQCTTEPVYFSICVSLPVVDGQVVNPTGTFETFDTFRVLRQVGNFPPQSFEHFAPSDFWTTKMDDTGKAYFVNKYENERRYGRNISIASPTQFNYFGDTVKTISAPMQGDIIAMWISDARAVLGICENDSFILSVADDLVRVSASGEIIAVPADRIIGDPQVQLGGQYGCRYEDAGSILFGESYALWADIKRDAYAKHNYSQADDISLEKFKSYLKKKFRVMQTLNATAADLDKLRFITGINRFNGSVILTIKALTDGDICNQKEPLLQNNETLIVYPDKDQLLGLQDDLLTFASFTPEGYNTINLMDDEGCAFISYYQGIPYLHPIIATKWTEFNGTAVDRVVTVAVNKFPEKIKIGIGLEVQDETMWYVSSLSTDKANYLSEIPPKRWAKSEDKWNSSFLGNKNGRNGLYGRELPRGYFILCTFIRDNTINLQYNTTDTSKQIAYDELDEIIIKCAVSESSGMTENL